MVIATLMLACAASVARGFAPIRGATLSVLRAGTTTVIDGLAELPLDRYDAIILDQYGVLHNGEALLDGVAAALERLQEDGRKLVVLSNTSKRRGPLIAELPGRGFRRVAPRRDLQRRVLLGGAARRRLRERRGARLERSRLFREYLAGTGVALADAAPDVIGVWAGHYRSGPAAR